MNETKKVTSIARKINWLFLGKLFRIFVTLDFVLLMVVLMAWCYGAEMAQFGYFSTEVVERWMEKGIYHVGNQQIDATYFQNALKYGAIAVAAIEGMMLLSVMIHGRKKIGHKLRPLNEIAKKAEALSNIAFDEQKFHRLEDAVTKISPAAPDARIYTGDKDLLGLENALNNLLERMRDTYRQQSRFVSDASHELRTPIAVIQGYVNMLDRWGKEDEKILDESIEAIKNESEHMKKLVEQLLFLARGDNGSHQLTFEDFSLSGVMQEVYEESVMIDEKHRYEYGASDEEIRLVGDMSMIKQAARILVDNAAKYTNEGDRITIRVGKNEAGQPYFSIQDNGIGMTGEDARHVFERFYRSDVARNRKTGGTGLGLSIAKWIVDKHDGVFEILSYPEIGTRITVVLKNRESIN